MITYLLPFVNVYIVSLLLYSMPNTNESYNRMKKELSDLKEKLQWLDNDSFLLDQDVDVKQVYYYLKKNPDSAKFIFRKYKELQPIIKELCDPENPLYLDGVKTALDGIVELENDKEDLEKLKAEISKENHELLMLKDEIEQTTGEYDAIHDNLERIRKEEQEYNTKRTNIRTDLGLELIEKNTTDVMEFLTAILQKWDSYFREHSTSLGMLLDKGELNHMKLLGGNLNDMMERIHSDDFLSTENLDAYHKELMEKVKAEKENSLHEMDAFMLHNPKKLVPKIMDDLNLSIRHFQKAESDFSGIKWFNAVGQSQVLNPLNDALGLLNHLIDQVENKERRSK